MKIELDLTQQQYQKAALEMIVNQSGSIQALSNLMISLLGVNDEEKKSLLKQFEADRKEQAEALLDYLYSIYGRVDMDEITGLNPPLSNNNY